VHLSKATKDTVVLPNVADSRPVAWILHEAIRRCSQDHRAPALSGLYNMQSGAVLDLSAELHEVLPLHSRSKCVRLGAVSLSAKELPSNNDDSPFESFVKSIFSQDTTKEHVAPQPLEPVAPSLLECIAQLRAATVDELRAECGVTAGAAAVFSRQIDAFTASSTAFTPHEAVPDEASSSSTEENNVDDDADLPEAPILLAYTDDSPMFRRKLAEIDAAWPPLEDSFKRVLLAAKSVAAAGHCYLLTLTDLQTTLLQPLGSGDSCLEYLVSTAAAAWAPFGESCGGLADQHRSLLSALDTRFIEPLDSFLQTTLGTDRARHRRELNAAFFKLRGLALQAAHDGVGEGLVEAAAPTFERARLAMVQHVNVTFATALSRVLAMGQELSATCDALLVEDSGAGPQARWTALQTHCNALGQLQPRDPWAVDTGTIRGYLFLVARATGAKSRRWFYVEDDALWSLLEDRATPECIQSVLAACNVQASTEVPAFAHIRNGIVVTHRGEPVVLQADTAIYAARWREALGRRCGPPDVAPNQEPLAASRMANDAHPPLPSIELHKAPSRSFQPMASGPLEMSVAEFHARFVTCTRFTQDFLKRRRAREIVLSDWRAVGGGIFTRTRAMVLPVETALSKGVTRVQAIEMYQQRSEDEIEMHATDESLDVPYGSYFRVESKTRVVGTCARRCRVEMSMAVYFSKSTMFKGLIETACSDETKQSCAAMLHLMQAYASAKEDA
ncbi:hypothetical protein ACHHYP_09126, partial [Achlya hypogyna]